MKWYVGVFGVLAVVITVAVWPKPERQRQDEQQVIPRPVEKKPGAATPRDRKSVEEDIPASTDRKKVTAHRAAAGKPGEDGWYLAESTEGGFSVKLPNVFNDLTFTTTSRDGAPLKVHSVGTRTEDRVQYSVTQANRTDKKPIPEVLKDFANKTDLKEKLSLSQAGMQGIQITAVGGPTAVIGRVLMNETTTYLLMIENMTGTVITPEIERNAPIFFESFRLK